MLIALEKVFNPITIKVIETLEGCNIEEISKKLLSIVQSSELVQAPEKLNPLEKYPIYLQALEIQEILNVCETVAYQLMHHEKCPTMFMGKRMVVQREAFWEFLQDNKGKRLW